MKKKQKRCKICSEIKSLEEFSKIRRGYYNSYCKPCMNVYKRRRNEDKVNNPPKQRDNFNGYF